MSYLKKQPNLGSSGSSLSVGTEHVAVSLRAELRLGKAAAHVCWAMHYQTHDTHCLLSSSQPSNELDTSSPFYRRGHGVTGKVANFHYLGRCTLEQMIQIWVS